MTSARNELASENNALGLNNPLTLAGNDSDNSLGLLNDSVKDGKLRDKCDVNFGLAEDLDFVLKCFHPLGILEEEENQERHTVVIFLRSAKGSRIRKKRDKAHVEATGGRRSISVTFREAGDEGC